MRPHDIRARASGARRALGTVWACNVTDVDDKIILGLALGVWAGRGVWVGGQGGWAGGWVGRPGEVSRGAAPAGYEPTHRRNHRCVTAATTGLACRHVSFTPLIPHAAPSCPIMPPLSVPLSTHLSCPLSCSVPCLLAGHCPPASLRPSAPHE